MEKRKHTKEAEEPMTGKTLKNKGARPKPDDRKFNLFLWGEHRPASAFVFQLIDFTSSRCSSGGDALPLWLSQSFHGLVTPDDLR